jgi:hypothetical protein
MRQASFAGSRQTGGAILTVVLVLVLVALAYFGYRAYSFYRTSVEPIVAEVSKVAESAAKVVAGASEVAGNLNPYRLTKDPDEVAQQLQASFGIAPPDGYVGAFGLTFELLGHKHLQLEALIPRGTQPSDIFEGGRNVIRFNPGPATIFLAARSQLSDRDEMRDALASIVGGNAQMEALRPVRIAAGGRSVAAYRGTAENYGALNAIVFVFLDEGRLFFATGPKDSFDENALERALAALVKAHPANELLYRHPQAEAIAAPRADPCGIQGLGGDFEVVVVSVARGSTRLDVAIDTSGREVFREDVVVGSTAKPVVLVLMGDEPIVWNVGRTEGARIAGVLAQGQLRQAVIGLPKSTRVTTYSSSDGPNACPSFRAGTPDSREHTVAQRRIRELFGRGIDTFLYRKAGGRFVVGDVSGDVAYSPDLTLKSVSLPDDVLPGGPRGIERLVKQQAIRPAADDEIDAWLRGAATRSGQPLDKYRHAMNSRLGRDNVYVVLREFDLPENLGGANARTFIIPPGASRPGGPQGHCTFLAMEGYQCYGVGCR